MRTKEIWTNKTEISGDFGITDNKGRMIGYLIKLFDVEYVEIKDDEQVWFSSHSVGEYFAFYPQATRDGKPYGPCQAIKEYITKVERNAAIPEYIESARKRNQRKFK